jgi:hypothetical protein
VPEQHAIQRPGRGHQASRDHCASRSCRSACRSPDS